MTMIPAEALVRSDRRFVNFHLSVSRLKRFEQCPLAFKFHYIDELKGTQSEPAAFGTMLHEALESLFGWVVREEYSGRLPEDVLLECYRDAWTKSGLAGAPLYQEGLTILRSYARSHPDVDAFSILATEQEFNLALEEFTINGYIDRVDKIDDETVAIIDYKSNRLLFSREEVDTDLQMSVYALAAQQLYPWAKTVRFVFHMLRHGVELVTDRSQEQLADARSYVLATGRQTERADIFPPKLNPNCTYCDHRAHCPAYAEAVHRADQIVLTTPEALDDVSRLRERCHHVIKILDGKKRECEGIIRRELENADQVTLGGTVYKLVPWTSSTDYPVDETLRILQSLTTDEGLPVWDAAEIRKAVLTVDGKKLKGLLEAGVSRTSRALLLKAELELESLATKTAGAPRLHATTLKASSSKPALHDGGDPQTPALPAHDPEAAPAPAGGPTSADTPAEPPPTAPARTRRTKTKEPATPAPAPAEGTATPPPPPDGRGPTKEWKGRQKGKRRPWKCPCGFEGFGRAVSEHRKVCTQAPAKGERTQSQGDDEAEEA